jgi:hypothetical protein
LLDDSEEVAEHLDSKQETVPTKYNASNLDADGVPLVGTTAPLRDDYTIVSNCSMLLCIMEVDPWSWDANSSLVSGTGAHSEKVFELLSHKDAGVRACTELETHGVDIFGSSVARKISQDEDCQNALTISPALPPYSGEHTISFRVVGLREWGVIVGVISDNAAHGADPTGGKFVNMRA